MDTSPPLSVAATIDSYGATSIAKAMGLPISTVHTWKRKNCIPGEGTLHDLKVSAFKTAVRTLKPKSERKRVAA